jgi:hypothetical protein
MVVEVMVVLVMAVLVVLLMPLLMLVGVVGFSFSILSFLDPYFTQPLGVTIPSQMGGTITATNQPANQP